MLRLYSSYVNTFPQLLGTFYRLCRTSDEFSQFLMVRPQLPALLGWMCARLHSQCVIRYLNSKTRQGIQLQLKTATFTLDNLFVTNM